MRRYYLSVLKPKDKKTRILPATREKGSTGDRDSSTTAKNTAKAGAGASGPRVIPLKKRKEGLVPLNGGGSDALAGQMHRKEDSAPLDEKEHAASAGQAPRKEDGLSIELVTSTLKPPEDTGGSNERSMDEQPVQFTEKESIFVKRPTPNEDYAGPRRKAVRILDSEEEQTRPLCHKFDKDNTDERIVVAAASLPMRALSVLMELTGMGRNVALYALLYSSGDIRVAYDYLMGRGRLPWDAESDQAVSQGNAGRIAKTLEEIVERAEFLCELSEP